MIAVKKLSFVLVLLIGAAAAQYWLLVSRSTEVRPLPIIIPSSVIRAGDLGLHTMTAGLLWVGAIQRLAPLGFDGLDRYIRQINDLDPKFSYPYAFGVLLLGGQSGPATDAAIAIGTRGIAEADPDWRIPYYLATTYHAARKDRTHAAYYFNVAAHTPGVPENIKGVAANYGSRFTYRQETEQIWTSIYETSRDETVREQAAGYVTHLQTLDLLERAAVQYKKQFGTFPTRAEELVAARILKRVPESAFGLTWMLDAAGHASAVKLAP